MTDAPTITLLRRWNKGDRAALIELVERNLAWVHDHVRRRIGPNLRGHAESIDFVQEAMIDFMEYGPRFEVSDDEQFRALMVKIVENNLRDENKRLHRQRRDVARERGRASDTVLNLDPPQQSVQTPSLVVDRQEKHEWIRLALEFLDPLDREVLRLREWEGMTFEAIGERLDMTENGARMRYRRALPKLARQVKQLRTRGCVS